MLTTKQIEQAIANENKEVEAKVTGDGYHFEAVVISDVFEGLTKVARQQWVYATLNPWILSGELHAISMQTWTRLEWEKQKSG